MTADNLTANEMEALAGSTLGIPPFLFRAFASGGSRGINTADEMRPLTTETLPRRSLFMESRRTIKTMLRSHLLWDYRHGSGFISWSSSLLWVLEHAARMRTYEMKMDIHIAIMDTRKVHDMALFPAISLMATYGLPDSQDVHAGKLQRDYYESEYLFYGNIINTPCHHYYKAVPWSQICAVDLIRSLTTFSDRSPHDSQLYRRITTLRRLFNGSTDLERPERVLPIALQIGELFGKEFQLVMSVALVSLLCGRQTMPPVEEKEYLLSLALTTPFAWQEVTKFDWIRFIPGSLCEVTRMYQRLRDILVLIDRASHEEKGLNEAASQLSI